ncbi:sensor histidine kinase [Bacteroidota bacterium]
MNQIQFYFQPVTLNLYAITEETFSLYNSKALEKEITLTNTTSKNSMIFADHNMLKTILRNLVSNALKFTERGGAIEVSDEDIEGFKEIRVRDTGIGIDPKNIQKLFKLDESYSTEGTEDEMGTGLGLILCHEFIEKHRGKIWVESKIGFGSKFIFTLPIQN